jgi:excisionase family DNA binding protein
VAREYYSIPEAAALLGVSRIAVFKRVKRGQLPALRFGRNWAVPASALEPDLKPGKPTPVRPAPEPPENTMKSREEASNSEMDSIGWD